MVKKKASYSDLAGESSAATSNEGSPRHEDIPMDV